MQRFFTRLISKYFVQPVERLGRSTLKDDMLPDDLLIISCEEDYSTLVPLLEKGNAALLGEFL